MALSCEESATKTYNETSQTTDSQELSPNHPPATPPTIETSPKGKKDHTHPAPPRSHQAHMTINQIAQKPSKVQTSKASSIPPLGGKGAAQLCEELSASLRKPSSRTLRLIDRALSYLLPFESPRAATASQSERQDLLTLLLTHRDILSPYLNPDRIKTNLLQAP